MGESKFKKRIGILLENLTVHYYEASIVRELLESENIDVVAILLCDYRHPKEFAVNKSYKNKLWRWWSSKYLYPRIDALAPVDIADNVKNLDKIVCVFEKNTPFSYVASNSTVHTVANLKLDAIVSLQYKIIRGEFLEAANHGVLSFHHGDESKYRGGPAGFWELYNGEKICGAILQILSDKLDAGTVIRRGYFPVESISLCNTLNRIFLESSCWVCAAINNLDSFRYPDDANSKKSKHGRLYRDPNNYQMIWYFVRNLIVRTKKLLIDIFFEEIWNFGYSKTSSRDLHSTQLSQARWSSELKWPYFQADPFSLSKMGVDAVLIETFDHIQNKGIIDSISSKSNVRQSILSGSVHFSYPFIFKDQGSFYLIPECHQSNKVTVYKLSLDTNQSSPSLNSLTVTDPVDILKDISAADATLFKWNDKYWLFFTKVDSIFDGNNSLFIYYADSLFGPYHSHSQNPVKVDVRSTRPAGEMFEMDGHIFRFAQDCSSTYGGAITLNKILKLSSSEFEEISIKRIEPIAPYSYGIHHIDSHFDGIVFDGKRLSFNFLRLAHLFTILKINNSNRALNLISLPDKYVFSPNGPDNYVSAEGVGADGWAKRNIRIHMVGSGKYNFYLNLMIPGWNSAQTRLIKWRSSESVSGIVKIKPGDQILTLENLILNGASNIELKFNKVDQIPPPDRRKVSALIKEIRFEKIEN